MPYRNASPRATEASTPASATLLRLPAPAWHEDVVTRFAIGSLFGPPLVWLFSRPTDASDVWMVIGACAISAVLVMASVRSRVPTEVTLVHDEGGRALLVDQRWMLGLRRIRFRTEAEPELVLESGGFSTAREPVRLRVRVTLGDGPPIAIEDVTSHRREEAVRACAAGFRERAARVPGADARAKAVRDADAEREREAREATRTLFEALDGAVERDDVAAVTVLLGRGLHLEATHGGDTPLERAALSGACDVVEELLRRGAAPTARALAISAWNAPDPREAALDHDRHVRVARRLLRAGASPDAPAGDAGTAREAFDDAGAAFQALLA